jgi:hypothetical protein
MSQNPLSGSNHVLKFSRNLHCIGWRICNEHVDCLMCGNNYVCLRIYFKVCRDVLLRERHFNIGVLQNARTQKEASLSLQFCAIKMNELQR